VQSLGPRPFRNCRPRSSGIHLLVDLRDSLRPIAGGLAHPPCPPPGGRRPCVAPSLEGATLWPAALLSLPPGGLTQRPITAMGKGRYASATLAFTRQATGTTLSALFRPPLGPSFLRGPGALRPARGWRQLPHLICGKGRRDTDLFPPSKGPSSCGDFCRGDRCPGERGPRMGARSATVCSAGGAQTAARLLAADEPGRGGPGSWEGRAQELGGARRGGERRSIRARGLERLSGRGRVAPGLTRYFTRCSVAPRGSGLERTRPS